MMTREALNEPAEIPRELDRWNWGAFLLNWIWGIGNSTFIALLMFVPLVNIVMIFVLGAKGSKWAWRNRYWRDADHFRATQRKWAIAGFVIWALVIGGIFALFFSVTAGMKRSEPYQATMQAVRGDDAAMQALGAPIRDARFITGRLSYGANGSGLAAFRIPVTGPNAAGTIISRAIRKDGKWDLRLVIVEVQGSDVPIVVINEDNVAIPNAAIDI